MPRRNFFYFEELMLFCRYIFTFRFLKKYNSKIGEFSSSIIHSGTPHCPGMDLAGTRDISFHSGTVPGNPGHLVTLPGTPPKKVRHTSRTPPIFSRPST